MINLALGVLFHFIHSFTFSQLTMQCNCLYKLKIIVRLYDLITRLNCFTMKTKKTTRGGKIRYYESLLSSGPLYLML